MQHLSTPEQPAFLAETENEAYLLDYVAREHVGNVALSQKVKGYRKAAVDGKPEAAEQAFIGEEAALLLGGLARVLEVVSRDNHRYVPAEDMLNDYQQSLAEATAASAPRLVAAA